MSTNGSYVAYAGLLVTLLSYCGVFVSADQAAAILGGVIALVGVIQQHIAHNRLAASVGR